MKTDTIFLIGKDIQEGSLSGAFKNAAPMIKLTVEGMGENHIPEDPIKAVKVPGFTYP